MATWWILVFHHERGHCYNCLQYIWSRYSITGQPWSSVLSVALPTSRTKSWFIPGCVWPDQAKIWSEKPQDLVNPWGTRYQAMHNYAQCASALMTSSACVVVSDVNPPLSLFKVSLELTYNTKNVLQVFEGRGGGDLFRKNLVQSLTLICNHFTSWHWITSTAFQYKHNKRPETCFQLICQEIIIANENVFKLGGFQVIMNAASGACVLSGGKCKVLFNTACEHLFFMVSSQP